MTNQNKFVCLHGHFYQPPRENPWLEAIEVQDSAYPHHDWNERITLECYAQNTASRILGADQNIAEIVNNYLDLSFDFGPTLLVWMEKHAPDAYRAIVESDRESVKRHGGHGNALAQVYNHMIMPLANHTDKVTQVVWGIRDFQRRFGRAPEGMWLAETAVDTETLEIMAGFGIRFTVLSPGQARRVRPTGDGKVSWHDASGGRIDPTRAYRWVSPRGLGMNLFFYDGPISRAIAFEGLLGNGEYLTGRLMGAFSDSAHRPQLVSIATDGESYGHHHRFGDMALAYGLKKIRREQLAVITNYAEYLALHPPEWEVDIFENSSWSCAHGVERWRADCGCRIGSGPHWTQQWRGPLRESLNDLRDALDLLFEAQAGVLLKDPWQARNDYIDVLGDRSPETVNRFIETHQSRPLSPSERLDVLKLMEMQRQRMFMFTSCGWFFDEISGLESVTILYSAARAIQLAQGFPNGASLEDDFLRGLARARSNIPEFMDGANVYRRLVKPLVTDLSRVANHFAMGSLFQERPDQGKIYCYPYTVVDRKAGSAKGAELSVVHLRVSSEITREEADLVCAVLHRTGHDFHGVVKNFTDEASYQGLKNALFEKLESGSFEDVQGVLRQQFPGAPFTLQDVFLEDRRRILQSIVKDILGRFDGMYRQMISENMKLVNYLVDVSYPIPEGFQLVLQYVLDQDMEKVLENLEGNAQEIAQLTRIRREAEKFRLTLNFVPLEEKIRRRVEELMESLSKNPDPEIARRVLHLLDLADRADVRPFLWRAENLFYEVWKNRLKGRLDVSRPDDPAVRPYLELAGRLRFRLRPDAELL
ncbi:MAG TPA: DUF3536 domain-containing protein [Elusimicrobiota bacterium]|nr:DUF3536 domain-containing protein [Elusimicrobiota bacterium]